MLELELERDECPWLEACGSRLQVKGERRKPDGRGMWNVWIGVIDRGYGPCDVSRAACRQKCSSVVVSRCPRARRRARVYRHVRPTRRVAHRSFAHPSSSSCSAKGRVSEYEKLARWNAKEIAVGRAACLSASFAARRRRRRLCCAW
jgi:hypothetical protein